MAKRGHDFEMKRIDNTILCPGQFLIFLPWRVFVHNARRNGHNRVAAS